MHEMNGAELILKLLERQDIDIIAGIPGGANLPLYDALAKQQRIRHVLARHEQGAGFIAHGMARSTGRPAVCFATSGPGATNILTALADAKLDSVPVICITGQVPMGLLGTDAFQEVDTTGMTMPLTKHNYLVRSGEELLHVIPEAFRIAMSGRPGPVLIDVPKDIQNQIVRFDAWPERATAATERSHNCSNVEKAAEMINTSERPILYIGGGTILSDASDTVRAVAEISHIPATMTLMGLGAIPSTHPLSLGMLGMHAARFTNMALEECDLLIAVGARFDDRATGRVEKFCPKAKIVHIDIDGSELHKIKTASIAIRGDAKKVLGDLLPLIRPQTRSNWLSRIRELKERFPLRDANNHDLFSPYGLIRTVAALLTPEDYIVTDVGQHQMWTAQAYPFEKPRHWLTSGGLGTMGFGLPTAIGAALANRDNTIACFSGDGSLLMNIQELATAAEENVRVKIILMNNNSLGLVRQQQGLFYGRRIYAADFRSRVDFVTISRGFGVNAVDLAESANPAKDLAEAIRAKGPSLINVPIATEEMVFPMVPPGGANIEMLEGAPRNLTGAL